MRVKKESEKIQVTFNKKQVELIESFKGVFGETNAEVVRSIVTNWLLEKTIQKKGRDEK